MPSLGDTKTLLLTRPILQSEKCAINIEEFFPNRFRFLISPLLDISPTGDLPDLQSFQSVIFTSANGVRTFINKGGHTNVLCICVGDRTAATARENSLDAYSAKGTVDDVVLLASQILDPTAGPILYVRGEKATGDLSGKIAALGFTVEQAILYRQIPRHLTLNVEREFAAGSIDLLTLYSPMTASLLSDAIKNNPDWQLNHINAICISRNVEKQLVGLNFKNVSVAETPSQDGMVQLMGEYLRGRL